MNWRNLRNNPPNDEKVTILVKDNKVEDINYKYAVHIFYHNKEVGEPYLTDGYGYSAELSLFDKNSEYIILDEITK